MYRSTIPSAVQSEMLRYCQRVWLNLPSRSTIIAKWNVGTIYLLSSGFNWKIPNCTIEQLRKNVFVLWMLLCYVGLVRICIELRQVTLLNADDVYQMNVLIVLFTFYFFQRFSPLKNWHSLLIFICPIDPRKTTQSRQRKQQLPSNSLSTSKYNV